MRFDFRFASEALEFDVPDDRVVARWDGPKARPTAGVGELVRQALESALEFPPLRQAVVPGDHVVIAWDPEVSEPIPVLSAIVEILGTAGVEPETIRLVTTPDGARAIGSERPEGIHLSIHDPSDETSTAYLASTSSGRRIYLSRHLIDADAVVAVGRLGFEAGTGYRGPWSALYPALGNAEGVAGGVPSLDELTEVSWLLGSPFQVGILDGETGVEAVIAGLDKAVRAEGVRRVEETWRFRVDRRADLVVAGVGPDSGISELALGLESACELVRRGGKIVLLSRVKGPLGRACRRILGLENPRAAAGRLKGFEAEADFAAALRISQAISWADVYLLSELGDEADDLVTAGLGRAEEARRLVAASDSVTFLGSSERTRAVVDEGDSSLLAN